MSERKSFDPPRQVVEGLAPEQPDRRVAISIDKARVTEGAVQKWLRERPKPAVRIKNFRHDAEAYENDGKRVSAVRAYPFVDVKLLAPNMASLLENQFSTMGRALTVKTQLAGGGHIPIDDGAAASMSRYRWQTSMSAQRLITELRREIPAGTTFGLLIAGDRSGLAAQILHTVLTRPELHPIATPITSAVELQVLERTICQEDGGRDVYDMWVPPARIPGVRYSYEHADFSTPRDYTIAVVAPDWNCDLDNDMLARFVARRVACLDDQQQRNMTIIVSLPRTSDDNKEQKFGTRNDAKWHERQKKISQQRQSIMQSLNRYLPRADMAARETVLVVRLGAARSKGFAKSGARPKSYMPPEFWLKLKIERFVPVMPETIHILRALGKPTEFTLSTNNAYVIARNLLLLSRIRGRKAGQHGYVFGPATATVDPTVLGPHIVARLMEFFYWVTVLNQPAARNERYAALFYSVNSSLRAGSSWNSEGVTANERAVRIDWAKPKLYSHGQAISIADNADAVSRVQYLTFEEGGAAERITMSYVVPLKSIPIGSVHAERAVDFIRARLDGLHRKVFVIAAHDVVDNRDIYFWKDGEVRKEHANVKSTASQINGLLLRLFDEVNEKGNGRAEVIERVRGWQQPFGRQRLFYVIYNGDPTLPVQDILGLNNHVEELKADDSTANDTPFKTETEFYEFLNIMKPLHGKNASFPADRLSKQQRDAQEKIAKTFVRGDERSQAAWSRTGVKIDDGSERPEPRVPKTARDLAHQALRLEAPISSEPGIIPDARVDAQQNAAQNRYERTDVFNKQMIMVLSSLMEAKDLDAQLGAMRRAADIVRDAQPFIDVLEPYDFFNDSDDEDEFNANRGVIALKKRRRREPLVSRMAHQVAELVWTPNVAKMIDEFSSDNPSRAVDFFSLCLFFNPVIEDHYQVVKAIRRATTAARTNEQRQYLRVVLTHWLHNLRSNGLAGLAHSREVERLLTDLDRTKRFALEIRDPAAKQQQQAAAPRPAPIVVEQKREVQLTPQQMQQQQPAEAYRPPAVRKLQAKEAYRLSEDELRRRDELRIASYRAQHGAGQVRDQKEKKGEAKSSGYRRRRKGDC